MELAPDASKMIERLAPLYTATNDASQQRGVVDTPIVERRIVSIFDFSFIANTDAFFLL